jgi:acetyl-CoA carboxylase biotin carboxyl carrier protein
MDLNQDDVIQILKYLEESNFSKLDLEIGDLRISVRKHGAQDSPEKQSCGPTENEHAPKATIDIALPRNAELSASGISPVEPNALKGRALPADPPLDSGLRPIKSPMLGTFYRSAEPGGPPLVDIDATVTEKTSVCIIEVMKLFSTITAGMRGRIARICAEDGQLVEYDQVLFWVEPNKDLRGA